ncbi:MAG: hypothetical protein IPH80_09585 [Myxococcales bacterium]|nr:hypothetical protein [Myxococcales bacterium]
MALGRFGANGEGILADAPADALPHGILFLSEASDTDSLAHPAARPIVDAWATHGEAIDPDRSLKDYLRDKFFGDVHRPMYESRPIYFPLSSAKRSFVAYVSIHRWTADTLRALQAEHLTVARRDLEAELADLRVTRASADKKSARAADKRSSTVAAWLEELDAFIAAVAQCAERRPPRPDDKTPDTEVDARYAPDLDDGVMINAAALWPLLDPQWKDPKKWWKELASAAGKKDYDWSHLAARYFPARVDAKCKADPSLAVAHPPGSTTPPRRTSGGCGPGPRPHSPLDEHDKPASHPARAPFEPPRPDLFEELVTGGTRPPPPRARPGAAPMTTALPPPSPLPPPDADDEADA